MQCIIIYISTVQYSHIEIVGVAKHNTLCLAAINFSFCMALFLQAVHYSLYYVYSSRSTFSRTYFSTKQSALPLHIPGKVWLPNNMSVGSWALNLRRISPFVEMQMLKGKLPIIFEQSFLNVLCYFTCYFKGKIFGKHCSFKVLDNKHCKCNFLWLYVYVQL
jgi:hypothetical protein